MSDTTSADDLMRKWQIWINLDLYHQFKTILRDMRILNAFCDMFGQKEHITSPILHEPATEAIINWMTLNYFQAACVAIRRQADSDKRSVSLYRLLEDMRANASVLSGKNLAKHNQRFIHSEKDEYDPAPALTPVLSAELKWLVDISKNVTFFVNKNIAHWDIDYDSVEVPVVAQVEETILKMYGLYCKYAMLISGFPCDYRNPDPDDLLEVPTHAYRVKFDIMLRALLSPGGDMINPRPLGGPARDAEEM